MFTLIFAVIAYLLYIAFKDQLLKKLQTKRSKILFAALIFLVLVTGEVLIDVFLDKTSGETFSFTIIPLVLIYGDLFNKNDYVFLGRKDPAFYGKLIFFSEAFMVKNKLLLVLSKDDLTEFEHIGELVEQSDKFTIRSISSTEDLNQVIKKIEDESVSDVSLIGVKEDYNSCKKKFNNFVDNNKFLTLLTLEKYKDIVDIYFYTKGNKMLLALKDEINAEYNPEI